VTYPNLNSIDAALDAATETRLHDIFTIQGRRPIVKHHAGFLAAIPEAGIRAATSCAAATG